MSQPISQTSPSLIAAVGVVQRQGPFAQAFHLAADQHDAALERVEHFVFVSGLAILGDQAFVIVLPIGSRFFLGLGRGTVLCVGNPEARGGRERDRFAPPPAWDFEPLSYIHASPPPPANRRQFH